MPKKPAWPSFVIAGVAAAVGGAASAAGFGVGASGAMMGQPLDFAVQVRLDAGETLAPECISAEVMVGDRRVPASSVRTALEMTSAETVRIRVTTTQAIDEPVVGVVLNAGCAAARLTRRFVVLADPPILPVAPFAPFAPPAGPAAGNAAPYAPAFAAAPPLVGSAGAPAGLAPDDGGPRPAEATAIATPSSAAVLRNVASRTNINTSTGDVPRATARLLAHPEARTQHRLETPRTEAPRRARRPAVQRSAPVVAAAAPRLQLDVAEPAASAQAAAVDQALEAVAQAASAARASALAASAASERMAALERTVDGLRKDAQAGRDAATQLRERLSQAEGGGRWTWPLLAVVLALVALAAWLAWRLNGAERARQRAWAAAAAAQPASSSELTPSKQATAPIPFVTSEIRLPPPAARAASARLRAVPAWPAPAPVGAPLNTPGDAPTPPPPAPDDAPRLPLSKRAAAGPTGAKPMAKPIALQEASKEASKGATKGTPKGTPKELPVEFPYDTAMQRTEPMPQRASHGEESAPRDVSIEELIDLEQQAEFFVVLGQDGAAIELLVEHLRHTGGGSPLPYLKLLEVYRRRGDRDDYERTRQRFNHRFNAYAPDWDSDLLAGRMLESYTGVIPRLQQVWARPLDSMAELEALLFRKSRGELFDLPAYRDVLFLYALARDLLDREAADTGNVDLLLPLADGGDFSSTAPAPFLGPEADSGFDEHGLDNRPTMPVDFDLTSQRDRPTSIFGPLDGSEPRRR